MRTTITLADDVQAEVDRLRAREGLGLSEAVNKLVRQGMTAAVAEQHPLPSPCSIGIKVDVMNVAEALELLDGTQP